MHWIGYIRFSVRRPRQSELLSTRMLRPAESFTGRFAPAMLEAMLVRAKKLAESGAPDGLDDSVRLGRLA